jgi:hypothetical protein
LTVAGVLLGAVPVVAVGATVGAPAGASGPALSVTPTILSFPETTLGDFRALTYTVTNNSATTDVLSGYLPSGANPNDFGVAPDLNCPTDAAFNIVLAAGASCTLIAVFSPGALGARSATLTVADAAASGAAVTVSGVGGIGYYQVSNAGAVARAGDANFFGDASKMTLNKPIVAIAPTGDDGGYWLVASDGGVFNYGNSAGFYGSAGALPLNKPIVGMAGSGDGLGYWMVASDGGIFDYGDAGFYGSAGSIHLNKPIVGMARTPDGHGYWLVASDGGIFTYGDAAFYGSAGSIHLNKPIVGMAATPDGRGYWLVASDGGIFTYGDAAFFGSAGGLSLNQPIVAMAAMPDGGGYWFSAVDGGLFDYGSAPFLGSGTGIGLGPVVAMAVDGGPTTQANLDQPALRHVLRHGGWAALPSEPRAAGR